MPSFAVTFTWDHTAGLFKATLPNGAQFHLARHEIPSGRLANALELFRRGAELAVTQRLYNGSGPKANLREDVVYDPNSVRKFTPSGSLALTLDDLELDL